MALMLQLPEDGTDAKLILAYMDELLKYQQDGARLSSSTSGVLRFAPKTAS